MEPVAGSSSGRCEQDQCGGCLVEENSGGMIMLTCNACGAVVTDQQLVFAGEGQSSSYGTSTLGALSQKVKGRYVDLQKKRERSLLAVIDKMGCDAHIRGAELRTCKDEGIRLLKSLKFHKTKHVAAGLIYLALRRQCLAVTFREVSQLTHVGMKPLRRSVIWLKRECSASSLSGGEIVSDLPFTFQQRIQLMLDRLKLPKKETNEAKRAAIDLKEILFGSDEKLEIHSYCTILIFALDHVYKDKPQAEHWITSVANLVQIKSTTMNNKVSIMKDKLFSAAKKIPSLESRIREKGILRRNINKYIHYILENKSYLISLNKGESKTDNESPAVTSEDESNMATEPTAPSGDIFPNIMLHPSTRSRHRREQRAMVSRTACSSTSQEEERCSDLDDAELDTYLATDKEVKKKTRYFKRHHII